MRRLFSASRGASLVEYGLLVGLIAVLAITSVLTLGERTATSFRVPTAILDWYIGGVSEDYPARYRFASAQSPSEGDVIGIDLDGMSGQPFGSLPEASFEQFNLRSLQYNSSTNTLEIALSGNTVATTAGHKMTCTDLSTGSQRFEMDFDVTSGFFVGMFSSTIYSTPVTEAPFVIGEELACLISKKNNSHHRYLSSGIGT